MTSLPSSPILANCNMDPLLVVLLEVASALTLYAFFASLVTGNYSQVDKLWSFTPIAYAWVCVIAKPTERGAVATALITIWGLRLSYNFYRKGGYSGVEDYRWAHVRKWFPSPILWCLFNFAFICVSQNAIMLAFSLPAYIITLYPDVPVSKWDFLLYAAMALLIVLEAVADQQMWNFQSQKTVLKAQGKPLPEPFSDGFIKSGLFTYSRHPNFFSEISFWWVFYGFSVLCTGEIFHWSIVGAILLTALFQGSTRLTEEISAGKYPKYREYQQSTSRLVPWLATKPKKE